jgi:ribosomal protein S3
LKPNILAEYIALKLEYRISIRKSMKNAAEFAEQADVDVYKSKFMKNVEPRSHG